MQKFQLLASSALLAALLTSTAHAQAVNTIEELVVTADTGFAAKAVQAGSFRNASVLDTPLTVNVIPREVLEAQAAKLFSERASNEEISALVAATKEVERSYNMGTADEKLAAKNRFYDILISGSRNELLSSMFRTINDRINVLRRMSMSMVSCRSSGRW